MSSLATEPESQNDDDIEETSIKIGDDITDLQINDISDLENSTINTDDDDDDDNDDDLDIELADQEISGESKVKTETSEDDDQDYDDDDDDDAEQFKKLENNFNQNVLIDYHPELEQGNYHEILALCKIIRNKFNDIVDPLHTTVPWLTKFEKARVLGVRSKQLNNGAQSMIDVPPQIIKGYTIAEMELQQKKLPFIIRRPLPNGSSEYWKVSDLELMEY
tara:strand:+ start:6655 stop:7314 length:660 start_codon:yes stop_codon:yes gene_type:complete